MLNTTHVISNLIILTPKQEQKKTTQNSSLEFPFTSISPHFYIYIHPPLTTKIN